MPDDPLFAHVLTVFSVLSNWIITITLGAEAYLTSIGPAKDLEIREVKLQKPRATLRNTICSVIRDVRSASRVSLGFRGFTPKIVEVL